jgi:hypothetical protein
MPAFTPIQPALSTTTTTISPCCQGGGAERAKAKAEKRDKAERAALGRGQNQMRWTAS